ncbi:connectin-like isoform X2 [Adelges cooleyi]|uniref:connectin-like isoform X2 n=1 Tax=Adelges cooleyi TaxID=133065 RepID=UPI0021804322|nr:connectin-like isoform X2 [Adelges cooleyi]
MLGQPLRALIFLLLVYQNDGYVTYRRAKSQKQNIRSYPDEASKDINICTLEQKNTINLFCYCDEPTFQLATMADCWTFNNGEPREASIWREFKSQTNLTKLTFNVRGSTAQTLSFVPTEALAQLPELRTLEIVYAHIKTVHSHAFANLSRLQDLALGRNQIETLSRESIAHLDDLRVVTLGDNYINFINNDVFAGLPVLRKLYMDRNNISYIAEGAFEQLNKLEELDLSENLLTGSLSRYVFLGLMSLKRLDMRANRLERIGPEAFAELVSLEELVLEDNTIRSIDGKGFSGLPNLVRLTIAANRLKMLDDRTFHHLEKLRFLDMRYNNLQTLTYATVEPVMDRFPNMTVYIHLQGNVFECDCNLLWMKRVAADTSNEQLSRELMDAKCSINDTDGPAAATGRQTAVSGGGPDKVGSRRDDNKLDGGGSDTDDRKETGGYGSKGGDRKTVDVDGGEEHGGRLPPPLDESQMVSVTDLDENTCPGKEQAVVDGTPDAAQNSDRVLWESKSAAAAPGPSVAFALLLMPLPWATAVLFRRRP